MNGKESFKIFLPSYEESSVNGKESLKFFFLLMKNHQ